MHKLSYEYSKFTLTSYQLQDAEGSFESLNGEYELKMDELEKPDYTSLLQFSGYIEPNPPATTTPKGGDNYTVTETRRLSYKICFQERRTFFSGKAHIFVFL